MLLRHIGNREQGFTLIELAIVLTIAGLMFAGLWRLLNGGNQQVRDQSAASEQTQLIAAVKNFLASAGGQTWLGTNATQITNLPLPAAAGTCNTAGTVTQQFACYLPAGFTSATSNSYGQTYNIQTLKDTTTPPNPPNTYSFLITTLNGDAISDTSGGRLSASIGNDGGFIYNGNVCNAQAGVGAAQQNMAACGSYGTWAIPLATYGLGAQVTGHLATRTYSTPSSNTFPWLDRQTMPGDSTTAPVWNSMQTDLFLGVKGGGAVGPVNTFWLGANNTLATGGGIIQMQGGQILDPSDSGQTGQINMSAVAGGPVWSINPMITLQPRCTADATGSANTGQLTQSGACKPGLQVFGDILINGQMNAWDFYSATFVYSGSDIRMKSDIHPIADPLSSVMQLKPVSYKMKATGSQSMGVIAQDVEKVYPQLVSESGGMKAVQYDGLIAPLIGAVQELKKENDHLRAELDTQKAEQKKLEDRLGEKRAVGP